MNSAARLGLYGAGLVLAFAAAYGIASAVAPGDVGPTEQEHSQADDSHERQSEMNDHGHAGGHSPDGGPAPAGIRATEAPMYPVGTKVILTAGHMPGMEGAEATISGAFDTTTYSVSYVPTTGGEPVLDHRWVVHEELENPGAAPLADGAVAVLRAEHMPGMNGAEATIDSSTDETVYMVDVEADGMTMTNHKWVVESEIRPVE